MFSLPDFKAIFGGEYPEIEMHLLLRMFKNADVLNRDEIHARALFDDVAEKKALAAAGLDKLIDTAVYKQYIGKHVTNEVVAYRVTPTGESHRAKWKYLERVFQGLPKC
jgi:hypothetical protein